MPGGCTPAASVVPAMSHALSADILDDAFVPPFDDADAAATRILIVDDEESIRVPLAKYLTARGYDVRTAASGTEAVTLLESGDYEVVLCDIRMPGMTGLEVVPVALGNDPDLAILMLTAVNDAPTATDALSQGAMDYLMKPIELPHLERAVRRALHRRTLMIERRGAEHRVREEVKIRTAELHQRTVELEQERETLRTLTVKVAETLINAMEAKDVYLRGHSQRVAELAAAMAEELGCDSDTVEHIRLAGRLHDVGKIGIREEVLNKAGALTPEEFAHIREHVQIGVDILAPLEHLGEVVAFVHDHHERWDGTGYPRARAREDISLGGRIISTADAYDALTSRRAYREAMSQEETLILLSAQVERHLDPRVFDALGKVLERQNALVFIDDIHQ
jgi:putative two-component system response regulator